MKGNDKLKRKTAVQLGLMAATTFIQVHAQEPSRYMGGDVSLEKAPNGALVHAEVLKPARVSSISNPLRRRSQTGSTAMN